MNQDEKHESFYSEGEKNSKFSKNEEELEESVQNSESKSLFRNLIKRRF